MRDRVARALRSLAGAPPDTADPLGDAWADDETRALLLRTVEGHGLSSALHDELVMRDIDPPEDLVGAPVPEDVVRALVGPVALHLRCSVDRRPLPRAVLEERIARAAPVQLARDDVAGSVRTMRRMGRERVLAELGRPVRWDIDDPDGPLHWATPTGDDDDRARWYRLAARAAP